MNKQRSSRTCFLCGRQNDVSLKVTWYNDPEAQQVRATVTVPEQYNGYPGVVHGGIVAALLDETAGRSLLLQGDDHELMVTLKLEVKYRLPTPTGQPLTLVGWTVRHSGGRARVAAEIRLADGTLTAEGEALVARPSADLVRSWDAEKPYWRVYDD